MTSDSGTKQIRYGGEGLIPVYKKLRAGNISAEFLEDGTLRYMKVGNEEILRSIYPTFRDENWGTVPARFVSLDIKEHENSFAIEFTAEHRNENIHYVWQGKIEGTADGTIKYSMDGQAERDFLKNRIGFCVLHPMSVAGTEVIVETTDQIIKDRFAELITPHDPYTNIKSMKYRTRSGLHVSLDFEGDLFHTEDQRNWMDASYKTFCTPLHIPYPVQLEKGDSIHQAVILKIEGSIPQASFGDEPLRLIVSEQGIGKMPKWGTWHPAIGRTLNEREKKLLSEAGFSILRISINLSKSNWEKQLADAYETAQTLHLDLELEVLSDHEEQRIQSLVSFIKRTNMKVTRISLYPTFGFDNRDPVPVKCELFGSSYQAVQFSTKQSLVLAAKKYLTDAGISIPVGGGSRSNFTEFNRAVLPFEHMDFAEYAINPQVHAFDIASLIETLDAQALTVKTAKFQIEQYGLSLHIGSVTFKPRFNPYAASEEGVEQDISRQYDPRQHSLFGAGWTVGSIRQLSKYGIESVNYYEAVGPLGVMEENGERLYPVYHVFSDLADFQDSEVLNIQISDSYKIEALAVRKGSVIRLLVANLTNEQQEIALEIPGSAKPASVRYLDESTAETAMKSRKNFLKLRKEFTDPTSLQLLPFALACIDFDTL